MLQEFIQIIHNLCCVTCLSKIRARKAGSVRKMATRLCKKVLGFDDNFGMSHASKDGRVRWGVGRAGGTCMWDVTCTTLTQLHRSTRTYYLVLLLLLTEKMVWWRSQNGTRTSAYRLRKSTPCWVSACMSLYCMYPNRNTACSCPRPQRMLNVQ